ncbi:MAG: hypothetical protein ACRDJV_01540 [Actinomycetota bacterium]
MKRAMTGGAHRGPVAHGRQRRTIRLMQCLLVAIAAGLLLFAGFSWGRASRLEGGEIAAPRTPGAAQVVVPAGLALVAIGAAFWLGGPGGVRVPTPARLEDLAARAEDAAVGRERVAAEDTRTGATGEP